MTLSFHYLADDFRELAKTNDPPDVAQAAVENAAAVAAKRWCILARRGIKPFIDIGVDWPSFDDRADKWYMLWLALVQLVVLARPESFSGPLTTGGGKLLSHEIIPQSSLPEPLRHAEKKPTVITRGSRPVSFWRQRAQDFAAVCELLAEHDPDAIAAAPMKAATARAEWKRKAGYVGTKDILFAERFKKHGKNPPRTTLQRWQQKDNPDTDHDPASGELYFPETWVQDRLARWTPRA